MGNGHHKTYIRKAKRCLEPRTAFFSRLQQGLTFSAWGLASSGDITRPSLNAPPSSFLHADTAQANEPEEEELQNADDAFENVKNENAGFPSDSLLNTLSLSVCATGEDGGSGPPSTFEVPFIEHTRGCEESNVTDSNNLPTQSDSFDSSYEKGNGEVDTPILCFEDKVGEGKVSTPTAEDGAFPARENRYEDEAQIPFAESKLQGSPTTVASAVLITAFAIAHGLPWAVLGWAGWPSKTDQCLVWLDRRAPH